VAADDLQTRDTEDAQVRRIADAFATVGEVLSVIQRSRDYFNGYSIAEALQERISKIGDPADKTKIVHGDELTDLALLEQLKERVLSAIAAAKTLSGEGPSGEDSSADA